MSNLPFEIPFFGDEQDFSFHQPPNDPNSNNLKPLVLNEAIRPNSSSNSSIPLFNFQDLSTFFYHEKGFPFIGQSSTTKEEIPSEWARKETNQVEDGLEGTQRWSIGHQIEHRPMIDGDCDRHRTTGGGDVVEGSSVKKLDHCARERLRRMRISSSYLALRSLIPGYKLTKRWSAPYILDRAIGYIPQLQHEVEKLTLEKNDLLSLVGKKKQPAIRIDHSTKHDLLRYNKQTLTVSINEVKKGQVVIQICHQKGKLDSGFSYLLEKLEGEGVEIIAASSLCISEDRSCINLHLQMSQNPVEADYVAVLHKKLIFWLS